MTDTMLNEDYNEMLSALSDANVEFMIVGAFAMAVHGYARSTFDIDIWVKPSLENADRLIAALKIYKAPLFGMTREDFAIPNNILQIGVAPRRIDIINSVDGLDFDETWKRSKLKMINGFEARVPSIDDLITNKRTVGRLKDLADVEALEKVKRGES